MQRPRTVATSVAAVVLLLLWLCQTANSDGVFSIHLDTYKNPNSVLIDNQLCDTFGGFSPCDMRFTVSLTFGSYSASPDYIGPEYSNTIEASNIYAKENLAFTGAFPINADNWKLRLEVVDIDPSPSAPQNVDDQTLNDAVTRIRSTSFNGNVPSVFTSVTLNLAYSRSLTWSYKLYCATNYYSELCDKYCKPTNDITGHYDCSSTGDKVCLKGYWDPSTNCINTYCNPSSLCRNGADCSALEDSYICACTSAYYGSFCELPTNPCAVVPSPCRNGTCSNPSIGTYACSCYPGYNGTICDTDIDECAAGICNATGTNRCTNLIGSYACDCKPGWSGLQCSNISDYCLALSPCRHGNCRNAPGGYTCACDSGWNGTNCDADIDECASPAAASEPERCGASGTLACVNLNGSFACNCRPGWSGKLCSNITDYCLAVAPCRYGNCSSNSSSSSNYTCTCQSGWGGVNCDSDIDECSLPGYCVNKSNCTNTNGSYACSCLSGFEGDKCDTVLNPCTHLSPCRNGGACNRKSSNSTEYTCNCTSGWAGVNCDSDIDECSLPGFCVNKVSCTNNNGSYACTCLQGYDGAKCDTRVNPCIRDRPCRYGNCTVATDSYTCACDAGWSGRNCTEDLNECSAPDRCGSLRTCVNLPGSYRCDSTVDNYWFVILIAILLILGLIAGIVAWRVVVCRRSKGTDEDRGSKRSPSEASTVRIRQPDNVQWPNEGLNTLDSFVHPQSYRYQYGRNPTAGDLSPALPPRSPNRARVSQVEAAVASRAAAQPSAGQNSTSADARYNVSRAHREAAPPHQATKNLADTNQYDELRQSRMIGTGQMPEADPLQQSGPRPPVPVAPRPGGISAPPSFAMSVAFPTIQSATLPEESVYDNAGYLATSNRLSVRPPGSPGYLTMTDTGGYINPATTAAVSTGLGTVGPEGYERPRSSGPDQLLAPPLPPLPPKPPKVKRTKGKHAAPQPPPTAPNGDSVDAAASDLTVVLTPPDVILRVNSDDASAAL